MSQETLLERGAYESVDLALQPEPFHRRRHVRQVGLGVFGVIAFLILWSVLAVVGVGGDGVLPGPVRVARTLVDLVATGALVDAALTTLFRLGLGFVVGAGVGLVAGVLMAMSRHAYAAIYPIFAATFPLPKIALVPLSMVFLGIGDRPIVAVIAVSAFYLLPVNVMTAFRDVDRIYRDVASDLGVSRRLYPTTVAIPYALPMIMASLRYAWIISLIVAVAAEMLVGNAGLGYLIWHSSQMLAIDAMFAGFVAVAALGYASHLIFDALAKWIIPWQSAS